MGDVTVITPEAVAAAAGAFIAAAVGAWHGWRAKKAASTAARAANHAAYAAGEAASDARKTNAALAPVSNGFAGETLALLARIEDHVIRVEGKVDQHLGDHAAADVAQRSRVIQPGPGSNW